MSNKVEKGQKYKGKISGIVYEILSEPFEIDGTWYVVWWEPSINSRKPRVDAVTAFEDASFYTLIVEPKFKVGDRVEFKYSPDGDTRTVEAVSQSPDRDGDFAYIVVNADRYFEIADEPALKAAE